VLYIHSENFDPYTYLKIALSIRFWDGVKETAIAVSNIYQNMDLCFIFIYSLQFVFHWADPSPKEV